MMRFHLGVNPKALSDDEFFKTWEELKWLLKEQSKINQPLPGGRKGR